MPAQVEQQQQQQQSRGKELTSLGLRKEFTSLGLRLHADSPCISYVFLKHHKPKEGEAEILNALYVTGLPLGLDEVSLEAVFQVFGPVVNVVVHPTQVSLHTVVF